MPDSFADPPFIRARSRRQALDFSLALLSQDMYMAGSIILLLSAFTVFGTLLSDILLAVTDPRISFTEQGREVK